MAEPHLATGQLVIDSIPLMEKRWSVLNLYELWLPPAQRGQDKVMPHAPGIRPYRRRATARERVLEMVIDGRYNEDQELVCAGGTAAAWEGFELHISYLRQYVVDPTNIGNGTRTATLTLPSGATRSGPVHVLDLEIGRVQRGIANATLTLSIPNGAL